MQLPAYRFSCLETAVSDKGLPPKTYSPSLKTDLNKLNLPFSAAGIIC